MGILKCEICGGQIVAKENGVFECENCGIKYDKSHIQEMIQGFSSTNSNGHTSDDFASIQEKIAPFRSVFQGMISMGCNHAMGLCSDGSVLADGNRKASRELCSLQYWPNMIAVSAGDDFSAGLRSNGTVMTTDAYYLNDAKNWSDIVAISASDSYLVGLRSDGTVMATGNNRGGRCNVNNWSKIIAVAAGSVHTVGLRSDGTVVATKIVDWDDWGQNKVESWRNIVAIAVGSRATVGLRSDGTVVSTDYDLDADEWSLGDFVKRLQSWRNIVAIAVGQSEVYGLCSDGTVVTTDTRKLKKQVESWRDIIAISANNSSDAVIGLKSDGTVVYAIEPVLEEAGYGINGVRNWKLFNNVDECLENRKAIMAKARDAYQSMPRTNDNSTEAKEPRESDTSASAVDIPYFGLDICPKCYLGRLAPVGERVGGFSAGKAAIGAVVAGPVGLAAGALGKKKTTYRCTKCGYTVEK